MVIHGISPFVVIKIYQSKTDSAKYFKQKAPHKIFVHRLFLKVINSKFMGYKQNEYQVERREYEVEDIHGIR
jgi:hypothetical protein